MASMLGTKLAALRDKAKVANADLAQAMGVEESTLGRILAGDIERPPDQRLKGAAKALKVSFESLRDLVPARMREAAEGSYEEKTQKIHFALLELYPESYPYIAAMFDDRIIVQLPQNKLVQHDYTLDMDRATLTNPKRVVETFRIVDEGMTEACGAIVEASEGDGRWLIRVIESGLSQNGNLYTQDVLREAVPKFDGARVYVKSDAEHNRGGGSDPRNLIGRLSEPAFVESGGGGEIQAVLGLIDPESQVGRMIEGAAKRDMADLIGFSIDAMGRHRVATIGGRRVRIASAIERVHSVDLIDKPSAGGQLLRIAESEDNEMNLREKMIRLIEAQLGASALEGIDTNDDDALVALHGKRENRRGASGPAAALRPRRRPRRSRRHHPQP